MTLPVPIAADLLPTAWPHLLALNAELAHAYATRQIFRTETEARISVLNNLHFPTPAAKYWQCVREQCVMLEQLALLSFQWRRNELAIKRLAQTTDEEAQIDLDEALFGRANMLLTAKDRAREIGMWEMLKQEQIAADSTFDRDNVNAHQLVSYTTQFVLRAAHADPSGMNAGELDNLMGQLTTALARAKSQGVLDDVRRNIPAAARPQMDEAVKRLGVPS